MRVLLVGGCGSIGRRYQAVLRSIGVEFEIYDPALPGSTDDGLEKKEFDKAIIAAPTSDHWHLCRMMMLMKKPFICEKPLSKRIHECESLVSYQYEDGYVVCNWKYIAEKYVLDQAPHIKYDYYNTGPEGAKGALWDCCQLVYLDQEAEIRTKSPVWNVEIDGSRVTYKELEESYIKMMRDFLFGKEKNLWTLEDGLWMTRAVERRNTGEDYSTYSGKKRVKKASKENLHGHLRKANACSCVRGVRKGVIREGGCSCARSKVGQ